MMRLLVLNFEPSLTQAGRSWLTAVTQNVQLALSAPREGLPSSERHSQPVLCGRSFGCCCKTS